MCQSLRLTFEVCSLELLLLHFFTLLFIVVVGGLLSAHLLSVQAGFPVDEGWPCSGPLLDLAENVARKLLPGLLSSSF